MPAVKRFQILVVGGICVLVVGIYVDNFVGDMYIVHACCGDMYIVVGTCFVGSKCLL